MSSHLSLEELTAYVNGVALPSAVEGHPSKCATCRDEIRRWRSVADGLQLLTSEPPDVPGRITSRSRRLTAVFASAAAIVLIGSATYALSLAAGERTASDPATATSASGSPGPPCTSRMMIGPLSAISGSTAVLGSGKQRFTVLTSPATKIRRADPASLADLRKGVFVAVRRPFTKPATRIIILTDPADTAGMDLISAVDTTGFTLATGERVKTTRSTEVVKQVTARLNELRLGKLVVADGNGQSRYSMDAVELLQSDAPSFTDTWAGKQRRHCRADGVTYPATPPGPRTTSN